MQLALLPLDGADDEFIAVISRRPQGGGGANVISRATKQESAPNRRRNRFDEIKPAGWLLHAVAMTDSIAGNNRREWVNRGESLNIEKLQLYEFFLFLTARREWMEIIVFEGFSRDF